jgi:hypothetical protein
MQHSVPNGITPFPLVRDSFIHMHFHLLLFNLSEVHFGAAIIAKQIL